VGLAFAGAGLVSSPLLIAAALSATSLGLVVPVLKDAGQADEAVGGLVIVATQIGGRPIGCRR
jgi:Kef-type K+ transport system membrane component KefB